MTPLRASAGVGEPGRAVNPLALPESVRIAPRPSEIRYAKGRWDNKAELRARTILEQALLERDGPGCFYCGAAIQGTTKHVDHVTPTFRNGSDLLDNLVFACNVCNLTKGRLPGWFHMIRKQAVRLGNRPSRVLSLFPSVCLAPSAAGAVRLCQPPFADFQAKQRGTDNEAPLGES